MDDEEEDNNDNNYNYNKFVSVPKLLTAGIGVSDGPSLFYRRPAFDKLAKFVDDMIAGNHLGMVDGLPGTGKSSTLWWALQQPKHGNKVIAWLHLDRYGLISNYAIKPSSGRIETQKKEHRMYCC
eukprot:scaffold37104_cov183-Amphora_coffeaeformis.AAC.4